MDTLQRLVDLLEELGIILADRDVDGAYIREDLPIRMEEYVGDTAYVTVRRSRSGSLMAYCWIDTRIEDVSRDNLRRFVWPYTRAASDTLV